MRAEVFEELAVRSVVSPIIRVQFSSPDAHDVFVASLAKVTRWSVIFTEATI
jgi:hypothetical protein